MSECYDCANEVTSCEGIQNIYCDDCRWDIHYSRNWHYKDYTKEEWKNEQKRNIRETA